MAYTSNISKVVKDLVSKVKKIQTDTSIVRETATTLQASNLRRIHNDGLDISLSPILGGSYSSRPTLVSPKSFATKSAANSVFGSKSKRSKQQWRTITKSGTQYRLVLLPGGYKMIRQISGRQTGYVDLNFTGRLSKEFGFEKKGKDYVIGFTTPLAAKKGSGLESRNGVPIWGVTSKDYDLIDSIVSNRLNRLLA